MLDVYPMQHVNGVTRDAAKVLVMFERDERRDNPSRTADHELRNAAIGTKGAGKVK